MELHFIILVVLSAILLLFVILAICAYCCGDLCCSCGNSSYSHSRDSFHNETATTSTKTSSKGEYNSELYSNNRHILPTLMPLPQAQPDFEVDENHSTPLLLKDPPIPLGFGYPIETPQEEVREMPYPNGVFFPPAERVANQQDPDNAETSHHVETVSYMAYPLNKQNNSAIVEANGIPHSHQVANTAPLPNQDTSYSSTQINRITALERTPYPVNTETVHVKTVSNTPYPPSIQINRSTALERTPYPVNTETDVSNASYPPSTKINQATALERTPYSVNTETVHHVKTVSNAPYPPSKQIYSSDIETNEKSLPVVTNSQQPSLPSKNTSHSETQFRTIATMPANQRMPHQQDPEITATSYHVQTSSFVPYAPSKRIYSPNTETNEIAYTYRYAPTENSSCASDSHEAAHFTRSGSCPPSNVDESTTRNFYLTEPRRNKTRSVRTATYSSEYVAPYPISIRVANSVELLPSLDSEVSYDQTQIGRSPFKKHPSQVSLYDNV